MKNLITLLTLALSSFVCAAQYQADEDFSYILNNLEGESWSIGNGCLEANFKTVNVYGDLELGGGTLEILDVLIQVIGGNVLLYGDIIDFYSYENAIFSCNNSKLITYPYTLSDDEIETPATDLIIYPNPATDYFIIKSETVENYIVYNIEGKVLFKENFFNLRSKVFTRLLPSGVYFILTTHKGNLKLINRLIIK